MRTIQRAQAGDLDEVLRLLNGAASWLASRGLDQWASGFGADRIDPMINRGEVYLVREEKKAIATVTLSPQADPDFWTTAEMAEPSLYVAKLAIDRGQAGVGLGETLLRWAVDLSARQRCRWARLDAWRSNRELHELYIRAGWTYLRTVTLSHRKSGALFQHPAIPDVEARNAFVDRTSEASTR